MNTKRILPRWGIYWMEDDDCAKELVKKSSGDSSIKESLLEESSSVIVKTRPCAIISCEIGNEKGSTAVVAPITASPGKLCKNYPFQHFVYIDGKKSLIQFEQIKTVDQFLIKEYIMCLTPSEMLKAETKLMCELSLLFYDIRNFVCIRTIYGNSEHTLLRISLVTTKKIYVFAIPAIRMDSRFKASNLQYFDLKMNSLAGYQFLARNVQYVVEINDMSKSKIGQSKEDRIYV